MNLSPSSSDSRRSFLRRAAVWSLIIGLALLVLFWVAVPIIENKVRGQLGELAARACAIVDPSGSPNVHVDLLNGQLLITGLSLLEGEPCIGASIQLSGHLDTLEVTGLAYIDLLFHHKVSVRTLRIRSSDLLAKLRPGEGSEELASNEFSGDPWLVDVGSFYCKGKVIMLITVRGDTVNTSGEGLLVSGRNVQVVPGAKGSRSVDDVQLTFGGITGTLPDNYGWSIGRCALDQKSGTFALYQASIGPRDGLEQYSTTLRFEKDVIQARIDTVQMAGLEFDKALSDAIWSLRKVVLAGGEVNVLRDKTLPNGPDGKQPLLGTLIRLLPAGCGVDSVVAERVDVRYRERADRARGYADIPFGQLGATITGLRSNVLDTNAYVVQAHCIAFGNTNVSMVLRGLVKDTTDRFELNALIGAMPFSVLNQASGPLLDVRCTEGRIHSVRFHMVATDQHASGSVLMHYEGLKLTSGGRKRKEAMNRLETMLLNTLVQNDHLDSKGVPREGRFSFPRRQDRALFNYMWSGLREGTKAVLLPEVLTR